MATDLVFTEQENCYVCEINPNGSYAVEVEFLEKSYFAVYGYIDGLTPVELFKSDDQKSVLFQLDIPEGVRVRMVSWKPVKSAKII